MKKLRAENIKEWYGKSRAFKDEDIISFSPQMAYEVEKDKDAMVMAIMYLEEYIAYRSKIKENFTFGDAGVNTALSVLLDRVSIYSCPNPKKEHLRKKENCPLKDKCKCQKT